jgi:S1-C subfamily serine protease
MKRKRIISVFQYRSYQRFRGKERIMKRLRNIVIIVLSIIVFQQFYGCRGCSQSGIRSGAVSSNEKKVSTEYSNPDKGLDNQASPLAVSLNQLFNKYRSAVFMVLTSNGEQDYQGTGFFITADGVAVSNYHVFEGTSRGNDLIKTADGIELQIEKVLSQSRDDDFIIFKVRLNNRVEFTPIPIAQNNPEIGEDVFAIGNPLGFEHTLSKGIVSGYRNNKSLIQTTAEITRGSSGGPLMNMKGEVVGITTAGMGEANLNFAVNIEVLDLNRF